MQINDTTDLLHLPTSASSFFINPNQPGVGVGKMPPSW